MRTINKTGQFKRDFKRESKGKHKKTVASSNHAIELVKPHGVLRFMVSLWLPAIVFGRDWLFK